MDTPSSLTPEQIQKLVRKNHALKREYMEKHAQTIGLLELQVQMQEHLLEETKSQLALRKTIMGLLIRDHAGKLSPEEKKHLQELEQEAAAAVPVLAPNL